MSVRILPRVDLLFPLSVEASAAETIRRYDTERSILFSSRGMRTYVTRMETILFSPVTLSLSQRINPITPEVSPNLRNYEPLRYCPRIPK